MLLWDEVTLRRWDVCCAWHAPGPAFVTSSNVTEITVELNDVYDPCDFNISIMAVEKPADGELEVRYLSAAEGERLLLLRRGLVCCVVGEVAFG